MPKAVLQFLPCKGSGAGAALVADPRVDAVILTGGTETAQRMLAARLEMYLMAETGGKDATIVTALADREQAIKHVLHSAFSRSGQKCSATSLLILESEVYDDPDFRRALCDAVVSLDEREQQTWKARIEAGNLYINRVTTGTVVLRQPFGRMASRYSVPASRPAGRITWRNS